MAIGFPAFGVFYGVFYGGILSFAYLFVRMHGHDGGLTLFAAAAACAWLAHLVVWPKRTIQGLAQPKMLFRGMLFGLTQVFIFKVQKAGLTSAALVSSTMGSVFGVLLGRVYLKEKLKGLSFGALGFSLAAVFINPALILSSYLGVIGGFIQGTGFVLARSLMIEEQSVRQSVATGLFVAAVVSIVALLVGGETSAASFLSLAPTDLLMTMGLLLVVQYAFFCLFRVLDAPRASMLTLSRIPWAVCLEWAILGIIAKPTQWVAACFVAASSALLILESRKVKKASAPKI
ncbi:hypothetical protein WDW86_22710 [Bdellovibrionota bacterium FG-2]